MAAANLADSFFGDLDDLSEEEDGDSSDMVINSEAAHHDDLDSVSWYTEIMDKVEDVLQKGGGSEEDYLSSRHERSTVLEDDDPEYQLIVDCNALSVDIENGFIVIHNFIRDNCRFKFPELESIVHHPLDYARVVKKIANHGDMISSSTPLVDFEGLLPSSTIMVLSVVLASNTTGNKLPPLPEENLKKTIDACDRALALDSAKKKLLDFVESRMEYFAPNLSAVVGSAVAAELMGAAGGLSALANMPSCNVLLLGARKKNTTLAAGFSATSSQFRVGGYLEQTDIFQSTPPSLRIRACRILAAKATLAARVDSTRGDPTGNSGRNLREEICKKIHNWQEPPPAKLPKPLPVPDSERKRKRGGRRLRKMKERYAMSHTRKMANKIQFGVPEES